jgi:hypothetical protein
MWREGQLRFQKRIFQPIAKKLAVSLYWSKLWDRLIPKLHYFEQPDTNHKAKVEGYYTLNN